MSKGQSIIEYVVLVGIVTMVISVMGVTIRRGTHSMIKGVADQIGVQQNAEQDFSDERSHLESMNSHVSAKNWRAVGQLHYKSDLMVNERMETNTATMTNMGFTADPTPP